MFGILLCPKNATMKSSLATAKSKAQQDDAASDDDAEDSSSPATRGAGGGAGAGGFPGMGGGAGGGMPDLASLMVRVLPSSDVPFLVLMTLISTAEQSSDHANVRRLQFKAVSSSES